MKSASFKCFKCVVLFVVISIGSMASAANLNWTGEAWEPYWDIMQNWDADTAPTATDNVNINNVFAQDGVTLIYPKVYTLEGNTDTCVNLWLGNGNPGRLDMEFGKLTVLGHFQIGVSDGGNGLFNLIDGDVICPSQSLRIGHTYADGTLNMTGGSITLEADGIDFLMSTTEVSDSLMNMNGGTITVPDDFMVGDAGKGHLRMAGGQINIGDQLSVADGATATGKLELFGGTITAGGRLFIRGTQGTVDLSGGKLILGDNTELDNYVSSGQVTAYGSLGTVNIEVAGSTYVVTGTADAAVMAKAGQPSPSADDVIYDEQTTLKWIAGNGADSHNVYFGLDQNALTLLTSDNEQSILSVDFSTTVTGLELGKTYYWRVDEVAADGSVTTGDVWSFETIPLSLATPVSPLDGATEVEATGLELQWEAGLGAVRHDVYFGTDPANLALRSEGQTEKKYLVPETLTLGETYYWRIDESDANDLSRDGLVFSFITVKPAGATTWTNADPTNNLWSDPDNWNNGVPGVGTRVRIQDNGVCVIDENTNARCNKLQGPGWQANDAQPALEITGGSLTIDDFMDMCRFLGSYGTLKMSGGVLNMRQFRGWHGDMQIEITGGEINVTDKIEIPRDYADDVGTYGKILLHGGVITADAITFNDSLNVVCGMDITEGKLFLTGPDAPGIKGWVLKEKVTAYDGTGSVSVGYDARTNVTTVAGCPGVVQSDFNGDCVVDQVDYDLLMENFGFVTPSLLVWDFDMSTDPIGDGPFDGKLRNSSNISYDMETVPGALNVSGPLLIDDQSDAPGLYDCELYYSVKAMSPSPGLNNWVTIGSSVDPGRKCYVGVRNYLEGGTQTVEIWEGNPPHVAPYEPNTVTGLDPDAFVETTIYYHYATDTMDWTVTDGTITESATGVPYHSFNAGVGGNFTIQGVAGTSALIDHLTFKIHGGGLNSIYDINQDGAVDQLDLDILISELPPADSN